MEIGSSEGMESLGLVGMPSFLGDEISRIRVKILLRASISMVSPAVSSSISRTSMALCTNGSVLSFSQSCGE